MDRLSKFSDPVTREFIEIANIWLNIDLSYRRLLRYLDVQLQLMNASFSKILTTLSIQLALELVEAFERNIIELSRIDR